MNICESLTQSARLFPESVAICFQGSKLTYRELDHLSEAASRVLTSHGLQIGDRVALQVGNCPAFPIWYYAILRAGGVAVSISTRLSTNETDFILQDSAAAILVSDQAEEVTQNGSYSKIQVTTDGQSWLNFTSSGTIEPDASAEGITQWHRANPEDPALILYTSGTTGFPKGATLSHSNVRSNVAAFNHLCGMKSGDQVLLAVPLFHCFGQNALLNSVLNVGGTLILQQQFDLNESKQLIREFKVNQLYGVPMMFQLMLDSCDPEDLATVEYCFSAAAPLSTITGEKWKSKFGLDIFEGYGLTETSPFASYNHRNQFRLGSIGTPIDAVEMTIIDPETGKECPAGELGEIAIRGPNVMLGYWNRPEDTAAAIQDGWFRSGDIGRADVDGFFFIVDRVKDMIAVGGMKVFPAEVERVIRQQDVIVDVAVVGVEEPVLGEQVIGFVVPNPDRKGSIDFDTVLRNAKDELASYKVPRRLFEIEKLPRNPSGKVLKTELRELAASLLSSGPNRKNGAAVSGGNGQLELAPAASETSLSAETSPVQRLLEKSLKERMASCHPAQRKTTIVEGLSELVRLLLDENHQPDPDRNFLELGMDSLMIVEFGSQLQLEMDPEEPLPPTLLFDYPRIDELAEFIYQSLESHDGQSNSPELVSPDKLKKVPVDENAGQLQSEVENLSEEEALQQLLRELD